MIYRLITYGIPVPPCIVVSASVSAKAFEDVSKLENVRETISDWLKGECLVAFAEPQFTFHPIILQVQAIFRGSALRCYSIRCPKMFLTLLQHSLRTVLRMLSEVLRTVKTARTLHLLENLIPFSTSRERNT